MRDRAFVEAFITFVNDLAQTNAVQGALRRAKGQGGHSTEQPPARSAASSSTMRPNPQPASSPDRSGATEPRQTPSSGTTLTPDVKAAIRKQIDGLMKASACGLALMAEDYEKCRSMAQTLILTNPSHFLFQLLLISTQRLGDRNAPWPMFATVIAQIVKDPWYRDLLNLTLGVTEPSHVLSQAQDPNQRSEALFYAAARLKTLGQTEAATATLKECKATPAETIEYVVAGGLKST